MSSVGFGPLARIEGPQPIAPLYGLVQAALAPASGISLVTDVDAGGRERWINGVEVFPYPPDQTRSWNACALGTFRQNKDSGTAVTNPQFDPMVIYIPESCSAVRIDQDTYAARATTALAATESAAVASEFMRGDELPLNPNLGNSSRLSLLNGGAVTSPTNALALLEWAIAQSQRAGIVHTTPSMMAALGQLKWDKSTGVVRTPAGTVVVPEAGYARQGGGWAPTGGAVASGTKEWMFATGPIEIRRSEIFLIPDRIEQAVNRTTNQVTYRAERYYLVDWDVQLHAAVLADRCQTAC